MFQWLFGRRRGRREIYEFWDGTQTRRIDPYQALIKLVGTGVIEPEMAARADSGDMDAIAATVEACNEVFSVKPFDPQAGEGLTVGERMELLGHFLDYLERIKKKRSLPPTPSQPTDSGSSATRADSQRRRDSDLYSANLVLGDGGTPPSSKPSSPPSTATSTPNGSPPSPTTPKKDAKKAHDRPPVQE